VTEDRAPAPCLQDIRLVSTHSFYHFNLSLPKTPSTRASEASSLALLGNPRWGAPRIHGELLKLGFELAESTVARYMVRPRRPPSQTWRTFLTNHAKTLVSCDFLVVPTVFFRVLFVFVILSHDRRRPVHVAVTEFPTSEWAAHQLLAAFPWDSAPRYLLRDRDGSYGQKFSDAAECLGIHEVLTAPQSPWQNAYVERLIGSVRRECLDHVIVLNETGLRRILRSYFDYYEHSRTHLSLDKDAPVTRPIQPIKTGAGRGNSSGRRLAPSLRTNCRMNFAVPVESCVGQALCPFAIFRPPRSPDGLIFPTHKARRRRLRNPRMEFSVRTGQLCGHRGEQQFQAIGGYLRLATNRV